LTPIQSNSSPYSNLDSTTPCGTKIIKQTKWVHQSILPKNCVFYFFKTLLETGNDFPLFVTSINWRFLFLTILIKVIHLVGLVVLVWYSLWQT